MSALTFSVIALACILVGTLVGMLLRNRVSGKHLDSDAKDVVRLGAGLIGTIAALVLGLLIASAKTSFDTQVIQVKQLTADVILLDQLLTHYGPEAAAVAICCGAQSTPLPIEFGKKTVCFHEENALRGNGGRQSIHCEAPAASTAD